MYPQRNTDLHCNCQRSRKAECPLPNRCSVTNLVYRATITRLDNNTIKTQTGCTVNFKQRYGQYLHSFTHENANHTCLCNHAQFMVNLLNLWLACSIYGEHVQLMVGMLNLC